MTWPRRIWPSAWSAHAPCSTWIPRKSFKNRFTSGSTSRSERLAWNFRWCSDSKSVSRMSRSSGLACFDGSIRVSQRYFGAFRCFSWVI